MKKTVSMIRWIIVGVLLLTSCSKHPFVENHPIDTHSQLVLRLTMPRSQVQKRTVEEGTLDESKINFLDLYFFEGEHQLWYTRVNKPQSDRDILIPVDSEHTSLFRGEKEYRVMAVANLETLLTSKTFSEMKDVVVRTPPGDPKGFVMTALSQPRKLTIGGENSRIGVLTLKRLAVKVRMTLRECAVEGYQIATPTISMKGVVDRGFLDRAAVPSGAKRFNGDPQSIVVGKASSPMYTYPLYKASEGEEIYLLLTVPMTKGGITNNYYYKVLINGNNTRWEPNHLYDVSVKVNRLGSLDPTKPQLINALFALKEWDETSLTESDVKSAHYLLVQETSVEMKNISEYHIPYISSDPIVIEGLKSVFSYVDNTTGKLVTKEAEGDQVAKVFHRDGVLYIRSTIPVNYNPKEITFTVRHEDATGVDPITVKLLQYPPTFITHTWGIRSSWRPDGTLARGLNNKAIYRITNLVPGTLPEGTVLGYPPTQKVKFYDAYGWEWSKGDYLRHMDEMTMDSEEVANMISPCFELASQLGATYPQVYGVTFDDEDYVYNTERPYAIRTAALYWEERKENGKVVTLSDWRLPTRAEIQLIYKLQKQNTAVKAIMTGNYYWSNLSHGAIKNEDGYDQGGKINFAHVRCVRDVKIAPLK